MLQARSASSRAGILRSYRDRWIARRIPAAPVHLLGQRSLFIVPSGGGLVFLALLLALLVTGINYQNNLVLALAFLLGGLFVVGALHTWANLAQLRLVGAGAEPVFAGNDACFSVRLVDTASRARDGVWLSWEGCGAQVVRIACGAEESVQLQLPTQRRGWRRAPRIRIESRYPLGLLRVWSSLDLAQRCLVYPRPAPFALQPPLGHGDAEPASGHARDGEDFSGFRDYRPGDRLRDLAWKTLAKGQRLQAIDRRARTVQDNWLRWHDTEGQGDVEARLAALCRRVLELHARTEDYGLELPGVRLEPARGEVQRSRALAALALFEAGGGAV